MTKPEACRENHSRVRWSIPTRHLNTLWTGLWPRMAARIWMGGRQWPQPFDSSGDLRDIAGDLQIWIESFLGRTGVASPVSAGGELGTDDPDGAPQQLVDSDGVPHSTAGSAEFRESLASLHDYLAVPLDDGRAPIHMIGRGGYDFILSEEGVDLWAPRDLPAGSAAQAELLDAYEYRRTGRAPLSIGYVMEGAVNFPDAPTGPGQIEAPLDMHLLPFLCLDTGSGNAFRYCGVHEGADDWLRGLPDRSCSKKELIDEICRVLAELGASFREIERVVESKAPIDAAADWIKSAASGDREAPRDGKAPRDRRAPREQDRGDRKGGSRKARGDRERGDPEARGEPAQDVPCTPLSADLYMCGMLTRRCWVVSGTVFRGVIEQFPRAVADFWSDDPSADLKTMDVREQCQARLETVFKPSMRFEFQGAAGGPTVPAHIRSDPRLWDPAHLMVTNSGFLFPEAIGRANGAGESVAHDRGDLLNAIITGRAGNPVFTDSSACM